MAKKKEVLSLEEKLEKALVADWEQPYKVPSNWVWTRLSEISEIVTGGTPSKTNNDYYGGIFPFIKPTDLDQGRYIQTASEYLTEEGKNASRLVRQGATSVCCIGSIGKCGYLSFEATTNQQINSIIPNINDLYVYYYCCSDFFVQELISNSSATTIAIINKSKMSLTFVPLPPLAEQERIVARIESLFSKLDHAKELAQSALDTFANRKSAILHKAFTGELTKNWRELNGVGFDSWGERTLFECGRWFGGGTPSTSNRSYWDNGDILWITSKDMKRNIIDDTKLYITQSGVDNSSANLSIEPAILFVMRSGILRRTLPVCMVNKPFTVNQDLKALVPSSANLEFLFWLCTCYEQEIRDECMKSGTTVESIDSKKLLKYVINLPTLSEQTEIVRILDSLLEKEEKAKEFTNVIQQIDHMKKAILARAFRGVLGTNDPNDENALELLKTIISDTLDDEVTIKKVGTKR